MSLSWCNVYLSSSWCDVYLCEDNPDEQSVFDQQQKIKSIIINMLQNFNHEYSSHNSNIKCVGSIIKYIGFEPIHYFINLNVVSSSTVFRDFDYMFLLIYYKFESIKLIFSSKNKLKGVVWVG